MVKMDFFSVTFWRKVLLHLILINMQIHTSVFLRVCILLRKSVSHVRLFVTAWTAAHQAPLSIGILQARILEWVVMPSSRRIFPTHRSNFGLPHCRWILYQLSHQGSPRILELVAYPISRGSSWPRNWTGVSCITGRFFTSWATSEPSKHMIHRRSNGWVSRPRTTASTGT